jgi:hypothetical protein
MRRRRQAGRKESRGERRGRREADDPVVVHQTFGVPVIGGERLRPIMIARNMDGSPWGGHVSPAIKDAPLFGGSDKAAKKTDRLGAPPA